MICEFDVFGGIKVEKRYDSVKLMNKIIHDENGKTNNKIFNKIMDDEFYNFIFIRDLITKDMNISAFLNKDTVHFIVTTKTLKSFNNLLKNNEGTLKYRGKKYLIKIIEKNEKVLEIYFRRR